MALGTYMRVTLLAILLVLPVVAGLNTAAQTTICGSRSYQYTDADRFLTAAGAQNLGTWLNIYLWSNPFYPKEPDRPPALGTVEWWIQAGNETYHTETNTLAVNLPPQILKEWRSGNTLYIKACLHKAPETTLDRIQVIVQDPETTKTVIITALALAITLTLAILALSKP